MITTEFYNGQGLGNQLWCYVTLRAIAKKRGLQFGIMLSERFLGSDFMSIDMGAGLTGAKAADAKLAAHYQEKRLLDPLNGSDIRTADEGLYAVADGTKIDGCMQDEEYIRPFRDEIRQWLAIKPEADCMDYASDDICVINFRGSGYVSDVDFFLTQRYWKHAIAHMRKVNPNFKFVVVTEDVKNARKFFPDFEVYHWSIAKDYAVIKNAHYLILSNSSFAWFPAWLSTSLKLCIAPKYWARHNVSDGYWSLGYNITPGWMYLDRGGKLSAYEECLAERDAYIAAHAASFLTESPDAASLDSRLFKPSLPKKIRDAARTFKAVAKESSAPSALAHVSHLVLRRAMVQSKRAGYRLLKAAHLK